MVRWVSESKRPFKIMKDRGFRVLMKTGRLSYRLPSAETISQDVKHVFKAVRQHIAKMLRVRVLTRLQVHYHSTPLPPGAPRCNQLCYGCVDISK